MAAFAAAAVAVTPSCTKTVQPDSFNQEVTLQENAALEEFAAVLSKVVTGSEEVRAFFKDEALKQFDRDFDVFYPYVKDHKFSSGETLREMLVANETYEGQIETIERAVPKLTVLIPSYSWLGENCFDVRTWDTVDDHLCVGYDDNAVEHKLYYKGENVGAIPAATIPSFPVLIVKSNERMKVSVSTKGGENTYAFADAAFDGAAYNEATKAMWGYIADEMENPNDDKDRFSVTDNFIATTELNGINPDIVKAYNEFSDGTTSGVQRDYIYYGMTKKKPTNGALKPNMRDMLYRFRLTLDGLLFVTDDPDDPKIFDNKLNTGRDDRPGFDDALKRHRKDFWGNGNYEFRIETVLADPNGGTDSAGDLALSIAPEDLFYVKKLQHTFQWNFFGNNWSSYWITRDDIEPKWYYPGDSGNPLPKTKATWNLALMSDNLHMRVSEYDEKGQEKFSKGFLFKKSSSVEIKGSAEATIPIPAVPVKLGLGVTGTFGREEQWNDSYEFVRETGSDQLVEYPELLYTDKYIYHPMTQNGVSGYQLTTYGNKYCAFSFLPIDTDDDYDLRQFLRGRKSRNK